MIEEFWKTAKQKSNNVSETQKINSKRLFPSSWERGFFFFNEKKIISFFPLDSKKGFFLFMNAVNEW